MAGLNDIVIRKRNGLNRPRPNTDRICGLVMGGVAIDDGASLNTAYPLYGIEDAEALGITPLYDTTIDALVWHHINEFYLRAPGQKLWILLVGQGTTLEEMCDIDSTTGVVKLHAESGGEIKRYGVVLNPFETYEAVLEDGISEDVHAAIAKAQALAEAKYDLHVPFRVFIEGRDLDITAATSLVDLATLDSEAVSVVVAQDYDVSQRSELQNGYAAIGAVLGMKASKPTVADSFAEVGLQYEGNLQKNGSFTKFGMGGVELKNITLSRQNALYDKSYIALRTWAGSPGVYISQSFTCALATSDFISDELDDVHNKGHREIYAAYVPYMNSKVRLNDNGNLPAEVVADLEGVGNAVFTRMASADEISNGRTYIDPLQDIVTTRKLVVLWKMVPVGKLEAIEGDLSFTINLA